VRAATRSRLPLEKEPHIVQGIVQYLKLSGFIVWRQNTGATKFTDRTGREQMVRFGFPGLSDVLGILPDGRFLAIEVKKPGGRVSPEQKAFLEAATMNKALAFVAFSADEVAARFRAEGYVK